MRIAGAIPVAMGAGLELKLGGEVPLRLAASDDLPGALAIEVGGSRYVAPLGPARLGIGAWRLESASDGWLELVTDDDPVRATSGDHAARGRGRRCSPGDAIAEKKRRRSGEVVLRALERGAGAPRKAR